MKRKNNLIFVVSDALRLERLGCYGNERKVSPTIDSLAQSGVKFTNAFTVSPITNVSLVSMFTGNYPRVHGVRKHTDVFASSQETLAQTLKSNGYQTGAVISCATIDKSKGFNKGFDYYEDGFDKSDLGDPEKYDPEKRSISRESGAAINRAIKWLQSISKESSFFLFLHLFDTHTPFNPDEAFLEQYPYDYNGSLNGSEKDGRLINTRSIVPEKEDIEYLKYLMDGELAKTDNSISTLIKYLNKKQLFESTNFIFTADHGCHLGERGLWGSGRWLFDCEIRIPLIMAGPCINNVCTVDSLVSSIDILPTVLDLLDIPLTETINGISRCNEINNQQETDTVIYAETYMPEHNSNKRICVRNKRWKYIHPIMDDENATNNKYAKAIRIIMQLKTLLYRLFKNKINRTQQIRRAIDMLVFKKEKNYFDIVEKNQTEILAKNEELYDIKADSAEQYQLGQEYISAKKYLLNELFFLSDEYVKGKFGRTQLVGKELDEANEVLKALGYR